MECSGFFTECSGKVLRRFVNLFELFWNLLTEQLTRTSQCLFGLTHFWLLKPETVPWTYLEYSCVDLFNSRSPLTIEAKKIAAKIIIKFLMTVLMLYHQTVLKL